MIQKFENFKSNNTISFFKEIRVGDLIDMSKWNTLGILDHTNLADDELLIIPDIEYKMKLSKHWVSLIGNYEIDNTIYKKELDFPISVFETLLKYAQSLKNWNFLNDIDKYNL